MATIQELVEAAEAEIECLTIEDADARRADANVVMVDVRDVREIWREGKIPGAYHMPRGMTEFWVDRTSHYHKDLFADGTKRFIFYCNKGWRSALAAKAARDVGLQNVAHMRGGYTAWAEAGKETEPVEKR